MRLGEMAFDTTVGAFGQFVLGDGGEEACCWPAFLVGSFGELGSEGLDRGQAQLVQHDAETGLVDRMGVLHAASPIRVAVVTSAS